MPVIISYYGENWVPLADQKGARYRKSLRVNILGELRKGGIEELDK